MSPVSTLDTLAPKASEEEEDRRFGVFSENYQYVLEAIAGLAKNVKEMLPSLDEICSFFRPSYLNAFFERKGHF